MWFVAGVGAGVVVGVVAAVGAGVVAAPEKVPGAGPGAESSAKVPGAESSPPAKGLWPKERKVCVSSEVVIIRFVKILNFFEKYFVVFKIISTFAIPSGKGEVVEWSITAVLKTVELRGSGGSNPSLSAKHENKSASSLLER